MTGANDTALHRAADAIRAAEAILITAGAGMGVDSGLPDFRGPEGFWRAYPPYGRLKLRFEELANPAAFARDPQLAWGFYGHRLRLYRETTPHAGFEILRRWGKSKPGGCFVFTSNVDGHFQRAGFDDTSVVECHGSILYLQCADPCCNEIWPVGDTNVDVTSATMRAVDPLPRCVRCGGLARPNILMFGDGLWIESRTQLQTDRYHQWMPRTKLLGPGRALIIECGAGTGVSTVRRESESMARKLAATLVRINIREAKGPPGTISISLAARDALERIDGLGGFG